MCKRIKSQTVLILLCNTKSRIRLSSAWRFFQRELLWFNNCNSRKKLQKRNICSDSQHLRKYITCVFSLNKILERVIQTTEGVSQLWIKKCHIMQSWWQLMKPKNSMSKIKIKCSLWEKNLTSTSGIWIFNDKFCYLKLRNGGWRRNDNYLKIQWYCQEKKIKIRKTGVFVLKPKNLHWHFKKLILLEYSYFTMLC